MTAKKEQASFGYDPLAWMNEAQETEESGVVDSSKGKPKSSKANVDQPEAEITKDVSDLDDVAADSAKIDAIENSGQSEKINLVLDSVLNIQSVNQLYEQLEKTLMHNTIEIDASSVNSIDTASLQLLAVFKQETVKMHKHLVFDFPSDRFIEAAELLDLSEMLEIDTPAAGLF